MKTLRLFNAVIAKDSNSQPFVSKDGYIIEPGAMWAKDRILKFYENEKLDGNELNKTFHKSWAKIENSTRLELLIEQVTHYMSTYGSDFQDEVYIPDEVLDVPDAKIVFKVVRAYTAKEMTNKCLGLLKSGIALKEETINDVLTILVDELGYMFTGKEGIKNKEAIIKIADLYGVLPYDTMEFFRYVIYRATEQSLLIKSNDLINKIKTTDYNPGPQFEQFGLERLAEIFNRFKPLFLAFKNRCPKTINKISKLSKTRHVPMVQNPLNQVTNVILTKNDIKWLDNATPYALFKALSAVYARMNGQDTFVYRVRNGKSFVKENDPGVANVKNYEILMKYMKHRFDLSDKKIFVPADVKYALPTSEKMYVGNIPTGTKFLGDKLAVGIYWEDKWGAIDLDLSGLNIGGKIGWNASYGEGGGHLKYSGDITSAPNGAVEYLYATKGLSDPTLVQNSVFSGRDDCGYKIIVGKGDDINKSYMMNPNNLFLDVKTESVQKQTILGIFIPEEKGQSFVVLNFGAGSLRVSGNSVVSNMATKALFSQWANPITFNELAVELGAELVDDVDKADIDLSLDNLEKDSFTKLFVESK